MDKVLANSIFTVTLLVIMIGIIAWAFSKKSKKRFDEAANLIFDDEPTNQHKPDQKNRESSEHE
ncbi:cbb3-type cytochrome oxidase subunit 3 [Neptunicella sp.]|uniref:cbb3-type cytochrome oxidase subunit 3 n=1 Tax=Neptunicella sp. TaxID=2125986 RepID=UPI003F6917A9